MSLSALWNLVFPRQRDARNQKQGKSVWISYTTSQITAELDAIEQFIAIGKPVPDNSYRFLAWAVYRSCHDAYNTGKAFTLQKQILILEAFESLMRNRSTTMTQRLENDSYYMSNLVSSGRLEGTVEECFGTLQQAIDRTKRLLRKQNEVHPIQGDNFPKPFQHCLNSKQETWPAPLHTYLGRFAVELVEIAKGDV